MPSRNLWGVPQFEVGAVAYRYRINDSRESVLCDLMAFWEILSHLGEGKTVFEIRRMIGT